MSEQSALGQARDFFAREGKMESATHWEWLAVARCIALEWEDILLG